MRNLLVVVCGTLTLLCPAALQAEDFPPAAIDEFNASLLLDLFDDAACAGSSTSVTPHGVVRLKRGEPVDPGDGLREVALEMVSMSLAGTGATAVEAAGGSDPDDAGDPPCLVGGAAADGGTGCSPGLLKALQSSPDLPATLTLDLFLEATIGGVTLFNKTAASLGTSFFGPVDAVPMPAGLVLTGDIFGCLPLYDAADPLGPQQRWVRVYGLDVGPPTSAPITARKLLLLDREGTSRDRMAFLSIDPALALPSLNPDELALTLTIGYDSAEGAFVVPPGAYDGQSGWKVKNLVARFRNGSAPAGPTQVRSVRIRGGSSGKMKASARGVGDDPIDVVALGAPTGTVGVVVQLTAGESRETLCAEFTDCSYKPLDAGAGAKLLCRDAMPAPACMPMQ